MKAVSLAALIALVALVVGCGSSGPSEEEAESLIGTSTPLIAIECAKVESGERDFVCNAEREDAAVTLDATVSESGESIVITSCSGEEPGWRDPCEGI
jgi:hypothetical protein